MTFESMMAEGKRIDWNKFLFKAEGRITRYQYWVHFYLPYIVVLGIAGAVDSALDFGGIFSALILLLAIWPSVVVGIKRCHDRNRSGWFLLVSLVPLLNIWVFIELGCLRGTIGPNRFGIDPLNPTVTTPTPTA